MLELLDELHAAGTTIVVITHDREIAARLPAGVAMRDGRVVSRHPTRASRRDAAGLGPADLLRVGALGLRARPRRAVLSALGIAIGIAAMIAVVGISASSRAELTTSSTRSAPTCSPSRPARTCGRGRDAARRVGRR